MIRSSVLAFALTLTSPAISQPIEVAPEKQEQLQKSLTRLIFADQCNKRLDMPEIVEDAQKAFINFLASAGVKNPSETASNALKKLADQPQEKEQTNFSLFNPTMCGKLATSLKQELGN
ncbi:hypothetical protein FHW02_004359 [Ochrobactrum sp. RH1CCR137]|nr:MULTISPECIES: hypothetical protein [unclassified Ochrobactrum]MBA8846269.1 hypothetical protein [Ochrobactrum sp. RH1CCR137]MBA8858088.1 hypothetical protein [Ochrobactrum sp. RH1CCR134]OAB82845.1 hypothetical protein A4G21_10135 [Brucella intermedia]